MKIKQLLTENKKTITLKELRLEVAQEVKAQAKIGRQKTIAAITEAVKKAILLKHEKVRVQVNFNYIDYAFLTEHFTEGFTFKTKGIIVGKQLEEWEITFE